MNRLVILPAAARYLKKIKEKPLKDLFQQTVDMILEDPSIGEAKTGDLAGVYCADIYYHSCNYELAYTIETTPDQIIIIILAGTRENFYEDLKRYLK